jgi:uncharacterized protein YjiS (DUF1127 family)
MLTSVRDLWNQWRTYHRIRNELLTHTPRELFDLRIGPGDIDRIAWEGSFGANAPRPSN